MINNNEVMWDDTPINISNEINLIWSIANKLRGKYPADYYKKVILPMTIIRRFECALEDTKESVVNQYKKDKHYPKQALCKLSGYPFYNTSDFNLKKLTNTPGDLLENYKEYLKSFSDNVQDIIDNFDFFSIITKLYEHKRLYNIIKEFSELNLYPNVIDNVKMGYIFEDLIRRFSENATAGEHYTGRDIIRTMVSLLLAEGCDDIFDENKIITILDQAAGTGGMLSTANDYIHRFNSSADILLFAQESTNEAYAICLAEMLIKGQNAENIKCADTMEEDCFKDTKMRFVIENPPFGMEWGGDNAPEGRESAVKKEYNKIHNSRFPAGLPSKNDMQMLFLQSAVDKMDEDVGRCAIIENGSPLFKGKTASGESQIRKWLLEEDLIEAIIQLSNDQFYNTNITTYIWILSKNKRNERKGKVQLINASSFYHNLRKSLGQKRKEINSEDRKKITELYSNFEENEYSKIFNNEEFLYKEYSIYQPLQRNYTINYERIDNLVSSNTLSSFYNPSRVMELENKNKLNTSERKSLNKNYSNYETYKRIIEILNENCINTIYYSKAPFKKIVKNLLEDLNLSNSVIDNVCKGLSVIDKTAEIEKDSKGNIKYDKDTKDTEIVKLSENIDEYMEKEVIPYVPDAKAFFEEDLTKKKPLIKTGAEINFTQYFYKHSPQRSLDEIEADIHKITEELNDIMGD